MLSLSRMHVLHYVPRRITPYVYFPYARCATRHVALPREVYDERRKRAEERVEAMIAFATATSECRVRIMLDYFGQPDEPPCGCCDICRAMPEPPKSSLRESIAAAVSREGALRVADIPRRWPDCDGTVADIVRSMLDNGELDSPDGGLTLVPGN